MWFQTWKSFPDPVSEGAKGIHAMGLGRLKVAMIHRVVP
jgi:hypothetical protein